MSELPQIALRRHRDGTLDDTVVTGVSMFRAEVLHDDCLWLCCYLTNGERITWTAHTHDYEVQEMPDPGTYLDFDQERRA